MLLFHKLDAGGLQFIARAVQIVCREGKMAQTRVSNVWHWRMGICVDKLQHYAICRLDVDCLSRVEQQAET